MANSVGTTAPPLCVGPPLDVWSMGCFVFPFLLPVSTCAAEDPSWESHAVSVIAACNSDSPLARPSTQVMSAFFAAVGEGKSARDAVAGPTE
jgi:hypothetical protein